MKVVFSNNMNNGTLKIENMIRPNTKPWGTPQEVEDKDKVELPVISLLQHCGFFLYYSFIFEILILLPQFFPCKITLFLKHYCFLSCKITAYSDI